MVAFVYDSIIFGFLAIDLGVIIIFIIQWFRVGKKLLTPVPILLFLFFVVSGGIVTYGSFIEPRRIATSNYEIAEVMPFLPNGTDVKIALIADFHLGPYKSDDWVKKVVSKLNELNPDIILIAGDFLFVDNINDIPETMSAFREFENLSPPLGIFAVLGNHDYGEKLFEISGIQGKNRAGLIKNELSKFGVKVLVNESTVIEKNGVPLFLLGGLEEIWTERANIKKTFEKSENFPKILLVHNPDAALFKDACETDLIIAGHTHAGQIRLPFWGSVPRIPDKLGRDFDQGYFEGACEKGGLPSILITRGLGETGPRARLFAVPEIVLLD